MASFSSFPRSSWTFASMAVIPPCFRSGAVMTSLLHIQLTAYLKLGITAGPQPSWLRYMQYFTIAPVSGGYMFNCQWAAHSSNFSQARTFWRIVLNPPASKTRVFILSCSARETPGIQDVSLIFAASPAFRAICFSRWAHLVFSICSSLWRDDVSEWEPDGAGLLAGTTTTFPPVWTGTLAVRSGCADLAEPRDIPNPRSVAISPSIRGLELSIKWASIVNKSSFLIKRSLASWSSFPAETKDAIFESTAVDLSSITANQNSTWSRWTTLRALLNSSSKIGSERILLIDLSVTLATLEQEKLTRILSSHELRNHQLSHAPGIWDHDLTSDPCRHETKRWNLTILNHVWSGKVIRKEPSCRWTSNPLWSNMTRPASRWTAHEPSWTIPWKGGTPKKETTTPGPPFGCVKRGIVHSVGWKITHTSFLVRSTVSGR